MYSSTIFQAAFHFYFNFHQNGISSKFTSSVFARRIQFSLRTTISFLVGAFLSYGTPLNSELATGYLIPVMSVITMQETFGLTLNNSFKNITVITPLSIFLFIIQKIGLGYQDYLAAELLLLVSSLFVAYKCSQVSISNKLTFSGREKVFETEIREQIFENQ